MERDAARERGCALLRSVCVGKRDLQWPTWQFAVLCCIWGPGSRLSPLAGPGVNTTTGCTGKALVLRRCARGCSKDAVPLSTADTPTMTRKLDDSRLQ